MEAELPWVTPQADKPVKAQPKRTAKEPAQPLPEKLLKDVIAVHDNVVHEHDEQLSKTQAEPHKYTYADAYMKVCAGAATKVTS